MEERKAQNVDKALEKAVVKILENHPDTAYHKYVKELEEGGMTEDNIRIGGTGYCRHCGTKLDDLFKCHNQKCPGIVEVTGPIDKMEWPVVPNEHKHIPHKHKDWAPNNYQCVCGFKTRDRMAFDEHLKSREEEG